MKSIEFIAFKLDELYSNFNGIKLRYEYKANSQSHLIEVLPLDLYEGSLDYMTLEAKIEQEFETAFPEETIVFVSEGSLSQISKPFLAYGHDIIDIHLEKFTYQISVEEPYGVRSKAEELSTYFSENLIENVQSSYNYALAA